MLGYRSHLLLLQRCHPACGCSSPLLVHADGYFPRYSHKFSNVTPRQPMLDFKYSTVSRFPLRNPKARNQSSCHATLELPRSALVRANGLRGQPLSCSGNEHIFVRSANSRIIVIHQSSGHANVLGPVWVGTARPLIPRLFGCVALVLIVNEDEEWWRWKFLRNSTTLARSVP